MGVTLSGKDPNNSLVLQLQRELDEVRKQLRQIPSRYPVAAATADDVVVRVRFDCDGSASRLDLSVGEILDASAATLDQEQVWIDGFHALASMPPANFGTNAVYYATRIGSATRSSTTRDLYRVTDYFGSASFPTTPAELVLEATTNNRCKILDSAEAEVTTTIAGSAAVNRIMARLPDSYASGQRFDWYRRTLAGGYATPDSCLSELRSGGNGGTSVTDKISIEHGEVFHLEVWANTGEVDTGFNPLKAASSSSVAIIQSIAGGSPVVRGTGGIWRFREDTTTSSRNYGTTTASWSTLVLTVKDYDYVNATITFTLTRDSYGRITQVTASSSTVDIVPVFQVRGGRYIA